LFVDTQAGQLFVNEVCGDLQIHFQIDCRFNLRQHFTRSQFFDGPLEQLAIEIESNRFDVSVLLAAEEIAGTAELEVESGYPETRTQLAEFANRCKAAASDLGQRLVRGDQKVGVGTAVGPSDAAAQLIQLRKAVPIGTVDDQGIGQRNIETVFNDGGCDEHIKLVMHEFGHHCLEFLFAQLPMTDSNAGFGRDLLNKIRQ